MTSRGGQVNNGDRFVTYRYLHGSLVTTIFGIVGVFVGGISLSWNLLEPISTSEFEQRSKQVDERHKQRVEEVNAQFTIIRHDIRERWQRADDQLVTINDRLKLISDTMIRMEERVRKNMP